MYLIFRLIITAIVVFLSAYYLPGVTVDSFWTAFLVAIVLGIVNILIRPIVTLVTLPITILTLGLFSFVINAIMIWLVAALIPGFTLSGFVAALLLALVLAVLHWLLSVFHD